MEDEAEAAGLSLQEVVCFCGRTHTSVHRTCEALRRMLCTLCPPMHAAHAF